MTRTLPRASLCASLLACVSLANATLIEFDPLDQTVDLGDQVSIDIIVAPDPGVLIGAYDFFVNFDASVLDLASVMFGSALGAPSSFEEFLSVPGSGNVNLFGFSLLPDLSVSQDGSPFVLATILFDTLAEGFSALSFTGNIFGQADGFNFLGPADFFDPPVFVTSGLGNITVVDPPVTVPEPATWILMMSGLVALWLGRRKRALV